jgi:hypothetical protein
MTREEADDLLDLARDLEQRALGSEKNIQQLDLARARRLRDLAGRIRLVVGAAREGVAAGDAVRREALGLRLEAMVALLTEPALAPPAVSPKQSAAGGDVVPIGRIRRKP